MRVHSYCAAAYDKPQIQAPRSSMGARAVRGSGKLEHYSDGLRVPEQQDGARLTSNMTVDALYHYCVTTEGSPVLMLM